MSKKFIAIILLPFFALSVPVCAEVKDSLLTFNRNLLRMETVKAGDEDQKEYIKMTYGLGGNDVGYVETAGHPRLPLCHYTISLPHDAKDISVTCEVTPGSSFALEHEVYPAQHPIPTGIGYDKPAFCKPASKAYTGIFPSEPVSITDISCFGNGERLVGVDVSPVTYHPQEGKCELAQSVSLHVRYSIDRKTRVANVRGQDKCPTSLPFYEYCVITSRKLSDAFTRLIGWERQKGLDAGVVRVEDILSDPAIKGDTVSRIYDDAGKVRQYLQYAYKYGSTKYVLFGGNDQVLPIRYGVSSDAIAEGLYNEDIYVPTDFYYSELNSNWDLNRNGIIGEQSDLQDYGSELEVGRLLCTTLEDVKNYTEKLIRYETNPGNGDYSYLARAFFTQANEFQDSCQAELVSERLFELYPERAILSCGTYDHPTDLTGTDVIKAMRKHYGYVSWFNHGSPTAFIVNRGVEDYKRRHVVTAVTGDTILAPKENANGLDSMDNKYYPTIAYSIGCTLAPFDTFSDEYTGTINLGQSFTQGKDYGGIAFVGNSRVGWIDASYRLQLIFNQYMSDHTLASSLNWAKRFNTARKHHHALAVNLIGSPNIEVWTGTPQSFNATLEYDEENGIGADLLTDTEIDRGTYSIRYLNERGDSLYGGFFVPLDKMNWLSDVQNGIVTLTGRNCLPQILPLRLQNLDVYGVRHLITSDVKMGYEVRPSDQGDVTFKSGSRTMIEHTGTVTITKGVTVEKGAELIVCPTALQNSSEVMDDDAFGE